ncbi:hypothetical protein ONZ45_g18328 [Pleurotus djamor]|nr:hypothetical protein ONZ45_g18328 [Pleurotus djamor]
MPMTTPTSTRSSQASPSSQTPSFNALPSRHIHRITQLGDDAATGWVRKPSGEYEYIPPGVIQEVDDEYELELERARDSPENLLDVDMDMDVDMDGYNPGNQETMVLTLPKDVPPPPTPDLRARRLELLPESFPSTMHTLHQTYPHSRARACLNDEPAPLSSSSCTLSLSDSSVVSEDESSQVSVLLPFEGQEEGQEEGQGDLHCSRPCTPSVSFNPMHQPGPISPLRHAFDGMSLLSLSAPLSSLRVDPEHSVKESPSISSSSASTSSPIPISSISMDATSSSSSTHLAHIAPTVTTTVTTTTTTTTKEKEKEKEKTTEWRVIITQSFDMIASISTTLEGLEDALERQSADFELGGHVGVCRRVRRAVGLVEESLRGACACEGLNWGEGEKREGREGKWEERLDSLHRTLTRLRTLLEYLIPPSPSPTSSPRISIFFPFTCTRIC